MRASASEADTKDAESDEGEEEARVPPGLWFYGQRMGPDGTIPLLYSCTFAYSAVLFPTSTLTFSSSTPSRCEESYPLNTELALELECVAVTPLITMSVNDGIDEPLLLL